MKKNLSCFLLLCMLIFGCAAPQKKDNKLFKAQLEKQLHKLIQEADIPGAGLAVIFPEEKLTFEIAAGYANLENHTLMSNRHLKFSGNIGKTYVAAIVMQMLEEGKLMLQDKLIELLPEKKWILKLPNAQDINVEMLLQHSSGLPRYIFEESIWAMVNMQPDKVWTAEERLQVLFGKDALHQAGHGWAYSDTNYILLGLIIEKLSGNGYYEELQKRILKPLKLQKTFAANKRFFKDLASGYSILQGFPFYLPLQMVKDNQYYFNPQLEWCGGGIISTTMDLAKWAYHLYSGKVLNKHTTQLLTEPVPFKTSLGDNVSYGIGSIIWFDQSDISYGHTGFVPGFMSIVEYFPQHNLSIALQINSDAIESSMFLHGHIHNFKQEITRFLEEK